MSETRVKATDNGWVVGSKVEHRYSDESGVITDIVCFNGAYWMDVKGKYGITTHDCRLWQLMED